MKKFYATMTTVVLLVAAMVVFSTDVAQAKTKKTNAGNTAKAKVIYTGEIGKKIIGYNGPTPLNVTIQGGKVTAIEALANSEGPNYMARAKDKVFPQFVGKTVDEGLALDADGATGATYTSDALIKNIQLALNQAKQEGGATGKSSTPANGNKKKGNGHRMTRK